VKEHPILFKGEMVQAILDGRKTQTRRIIPGEIHIHGSGRDFSGHWHKPRGGYLERHNEMVFRNVLGDYCPYGKPGDLLWVKQVFWQWGIYQDTYQMCKKLKRNKVRFTPTLPKDGREVLFKPTAIPPRDKFHFGYHKRSPLFMPKFFAQTWLKVKSVRVERVQDISFQDAMAEGMKTQQATHAVPFFHSLWNEINKKRGYGWDVNPWVWVVEFEKVSYEMA